MTANFARAVDMAWKGMTPIQIAKELNIKPHSVSAYLSKARKAGMEVPYFPSTHQQIGSVQHITVTLDCEAVEALDRAAARAGCSGSALARDILAAVLKDDLIDAVLDIDRAGKAQ